MSYNNNNVIVTISQHTETPGIVRTVYLGTHRDIQQYSPMFRDTEGH